MPPSVLQACASGILPAPLIIIVTLVMSDHSNPDLPSASFSFSEQLVRWFKDQTPQALDCEQVLDAINQKTKPVGSLGQLEHWAAQLGMQQQSLTPSLERARIVVFGGDHGVAGDGVSAFPASVTAQMMANFEAGGAAVCVLAAANDIGVEVVDVGVNADLSGLSAIVQDKVAFGTGHFCHAPAMSVEQRQLAMAVGERAVDRAVESGVSCIGFGEMGIGNTTSASAIGALLCDVPAAAMVGRGTGIDDAVLAHKRQVVEKAVDLYSPLTSRPLDVLGAVGGFEIAAITGAMLQAHRANVSVVVDGFICTAAALVALRVDKSSRRSMYFAHRSAEAAHGVLLAACEATPMLSLQMRLGEGSGCALAIPLLRSAAAMLSNMATFESAGVAGKTA